MLLLMLSLAVLPPQDQAMFDSFWTTVAAGYDAERGGYVTKDGAPIESAMELSFRVGAERGDAEATARALQTLEWTIGLFDTVGGGFQTRAKDADPSQASFDKMTIPNARRLEVLMDAWTLSGDERWKRYSAKTVDYFDRVLLDGRGGFNHGQVGERQLVPESNGAAIRVWMEWASRTGNLRLRDFAWKSLDRSWDECWMGAPGMGRRGTFGEITEAPRLADQIEMGRAYLIAAHLGGREADLARAIQIADTMLAVYSDPKGGFRTKAMPNKKGILKNAGRELDENARAARFLADLAAVAGQSRYREIAVATLNAFEPKVYEKASASEAAECALALAAIHAPALPERLEWKEAPEVKTQRTSQVTRFKPTRRR